MGEVLIIPRWLADALDISDEDERFIISEFAGWEYRGEVDTGDESSDD